MKKFNQFLNNYPLARQLLFFSFLFLLSLLTFWKALSFDFFQDDYIFLWNALYHPFAQLFNFRHPAAPLEALVFVRLFGLNSTLWELLGITIKTITAFLTGVLLYKITNSKLAGFLAGVFFATCYAGMYIVNAFNFHVPAFVAIFALLSLICLVDAIKGQQKRIWLFIIFFVLGIVFDPARGLSILFIIPLFLFLFPKSKNKTKITRQLTIILFAFLAICIPLLTIWYFVLPIGDTQVSVFLRILHINPMLALSKTKDIGNYFATIADLFIYPLYSMTATKPIYETLDYQRIFGVGGIVSFIFAVASFIYGIKKKSQTFAVIGFFILWTFLLYLPNFLAEPRRPMDPQHHYLYISAIGFIAVVAYILSRIKNKWILLLLCICFIMLNIYKVNTILSLEAPYRSTVLVEQALQTIVSQVPRGEANDVFFFRGNYDWLGNSITFFGGSHFLLLTKDPNGDNIPQFTFDGDLLFNQVCYDHPKDAIGTEYKHVPISHIYAWEAIVPGKLKNITNQERERLTREIVGKNCKLLEN